MSGSRTSYCVELEIIKGLAQYGVLGLWAKYAEDRLLRMQGKGKE